MNMVLTLQKLKQQKLSLMAISLIAGGMLAVAGCGIFGRGTDKPENKPDSEDVRNNSLSELERELAEIKPEDAQTESEKISAYQHIAEKTWDKDRAAYWRQEAKNNPGAYSKENLARMSRGSAPQRINPTTGRMESMELHHDLIPQRSGLPKTLINQRWNLRKVWPDEHRAIDVYR